MQNSARRPGNEGRLLDRGVQPPPALLSPPAEHGAEVMQPILLPLTPLGISATPPPLPKLPAFLFTTLPDSAFDSREAAVANDSAAPEDVGGRRKEGGGDWTPVEEVETRMDRRTFFHTEGKAHTFHNQAPARNAEDMEIGQRVQLSVEDIHFGNPRIKVMSGAPAPMPQMLKWPKEKFAEHVLQCAPISFGPDARVWSAIGIPANRLLYAMKRGGVEFAEAEVVAPPELAQPDEDVDLTYGSSIQGIQLVP